MGTQIAKKTLYETKRGCTLSPKKVPKKYYQVTEYKVFYNCISFHESGLGTPDQGPIASCFVNSIVALLEDNLCGLMYPYFARQNVFHCTETFLWSNNCKTLYTYFIIQ